MTVIPWLLALALGISLLQALAYRRYGLRAVSHRRHYSESVVYAGDPVDLVEEIENAKWLPLPWLQVESMFPVGLRFHGLRDEDIVQGQAHVFHQSLFSLPPYTRIIRRHHITCLQRGVYGLQETTLTCGNLLGATAAFITIEPKARLIVYPALLSLDDLPLPSHSWQGDLSVRRWTLPDPFTQVGTREYESGDPLHQINWKATARSGRLQVQKRDYTADRHLQICLNVEVSEQMWEAVTDPDLIEYGIQCAATIAQWCLAQGLETGFSCNAWIADDEPRFVKSSAQTGDSHLDTLLTLMARLRMRCNGSFHSLLEEDAEEGVTKRDYLLISAHQGARLQAAAAHLRELGNSVEWLPLNRDVWTTVRDGGGFAIESVTTHSSSVVVGQR